MKVLFDTSVLVAGAIEDHPKNAESVIWLQRVKSELTGRKKLSAVIARRWENELIFLKNR